MRIVSLLWTGLATMVALLAQATDLPDLVLPSGVGVNIHFTRGHERDLDLIAAGGFKFIRMDFGWASIERTKDQYDWSAYDELVGNLEKRGLRAIFILDYSNPLYEERVTSKDPMTGGTHETVASPQHPESVAAYARWAAAAAGHFKGRRVVWEIWNEPNIHFWSPQPNVDQYCTLALAAGKAIREKDPAATVVGPATSEFPWDFLERCFKAGLLEHWDAVSVHPYRDYGKSPETAGADYAKLRDLIARYAPAGKAAKLPILSGEWGYASHTKGVSLEKQAAFAVRQQLVNLWHGVPVSIWYDWKNDGPDAGEREHNFGTVTGDLQPKPAYVALQTLARELPGYRVQRRLKTESDQDYALLLQNKEGDYKLAVWTAGEPHSVKFTVKPTAQRPPLLVKSDGTSAPAQVVDGQLRVELGIAPQYVRLGQSAPE